MCDQSFSEKCTRDSISTYTSVIYGMEQNKRMQRMVSTRRDKTHIMSRSRLTDIVNQGRKSHA